MNNHLIKINTARANEIAKLYDIGSRLAGKIVQYRENQGYFYTPEDLARVDGVSLNLAITLAPHIDWGIPRITEPMEKRDWFSALILTGFAFGIWEYSVAKLFRELLFILSSNSPIRWLHAWINISLLLVVGTGFASTSLGVLASLTVSRKRRQQLYYIASQIILLIILGGISSGIGNIFYYQFYTLNGWNALFKNAPALAGLIIFIFMFLVGIPQILVIIQPSLIKSSKIARVFDFGILLGGPALAFVIWTQRVEWPVWFNALHLLAGVGYASLGLKTLRTGESFFSQFTNLLELKNLTKSNSDTSTWLTWINTRLPDPEQQKALKRALDEAYPPSKVRTILSFIVIVVGGWIAITTLSSIIDWFVQGWLNRIFPWFN